MGKISILSGFVCAALLGAGTVCSAATLNGFVESAAGARWQGVDTKRDDLVLLESRLQLKAIHYVDGENFWAHRQTVLNFKGDFFVDGYFAGKTGFALREANAAFSPVPFADIKAGRQVLTWGTGDLLFVNDLFPKDYISFFSGRDDEYLKLPSDAIKTSFFQEWFNTDVVLMRPRANLTPEGDRLSFYDSFTRQISGRAVDRHLVEPPDQLSNLEYALRTYRTLGSNEAALYFFRGFDRNPSSYKDELNRQLYYRRLDAYGASVRGPFLAGIANLEAGWHLSREDDRGDNRLVENSAFKAMAGYDRDWGNDFRSGVQYLYEQRLDYTAYSAALRPGDLCFDERRHLLTQRLTKQFRRQTVTVALFNFWSPSDKDGYLRPSVSWQATDRWSLVTGLNIPWGDDDYTEFGQMKNNRSAYFRSRYSF